MWIPPRVSKELRDERLEYEQAVQLMLECEEPRKDLNRVVEAIDPNACVLRARPTVSTGFPLKPGYWHFVRRNVGAPMTIEPIEGPGGEYIDPTPGQLERMLRERDLQNPEVWRQVLARRAEQQKRVEVEREELRTEVDDEVLERVRAATQTRVSMSTDAPWSQNVDGRRGARGD